MLKEPDIQQTVLEKIHAGDVSMHSRMFFLLRTILFSVVALLVLALSLFVLSFVFFSVHESGVRYLLEFGEGGIGAFVVLFPWTSLVLFILLLLALEFLVRRFTSAYRLPLLRIFLWILVIGVVGSTLVGFTPLHSFLLAEADKDQLPILGPLYEQLRDSHLDQGVYRGTVASIAASYFVIGHDDADRDSDEGSWSIIPPPGFDLGSLTIGQRVYIAGRLMNGVVYAYGIHRIGESE